MKRAMLFAASAGAVLGVTMRDVSHAWRDVGEAWRVADLASELYGDRS